ncbi:sodium ion-translocating decarboxylase subunit beta [Candidatus Formimonas warabiya]|uniref:Glutaconyl-CoA decarboxylase subunit beta n=1 Tax=Formimonas warabiya TaxID=1761012 RepID=A0A3G1KXI9_FORW1|nr:sodium ion-translocating decarboxylase subunit beta [Candidatus Formimonas warabiya]ATW27243.1 glutaconyl-CoA decarboxylase subunit beta [Candidatus Formimonas warabiya]
MEELFQGILLFKWQCLVMYAIGGILIYLAIKKDYEPMLLLPMGFGAILVNIPLRTIWEFGGEPGVLQIFYNSGILTEIFPVLIFVAVGAMCDFTPLLKNPRMIFFGAAAQFGIFFTMLTVLLIGALGVESFQDLKLAASIGIIGAADGPTSIFVASKFAMQWLGPISVAAYSYMSLVPIIQPPVIKAITTKKERMIRMKYTEEKVSKTVLILFPILVTVIAGIIAPISVPLIGLLMFGNLLRVAGCVERLSQAAQNELANLVTLLLGITIGASMRYEQFLQVETLMILGLGLVAFIFDTAGGVFFAKFMNLFTKEKVNPMVGAAGISAFPMSARVIQKLAQKEDRTNFVLMQAIGANVAGQIGSIIAGGMVLALVPYLLK